MKKDYDGVPLSKTPGANTTITDKEYGVRAKAKRKVKHILHIESPSDDDNEYQAAVESLRTAQPSTPPRTAGAIVNPKAAIKARATRKTAGTLAKSRPYLSRKADLDFLEAHDDLQRAEDGKNASDDEETAARKREGVDKCEEQMEQMERSRQNMRVAWVTARHVQRVRVVDAVPSQQFPEDPFFEQEDDCGFLEFNWGKWGHSG
ncbi:uncharacterized protein PAC_18988 [Phialocephala subalpina]|uniref:Uncharacterized protein n=1 Tax=Phialocephala subalpina TaxID=576137 RepID=A0A1L7XVQ9_9HELO|nr:uncharacterized protein PAC_18988 [Phialocephala subalpina]